jgi:hypothetical protein
MKQDEKKMAPKSDGVSFYFFDFDDNVMFLKTRIFIRNKETKELCGVTTKEFAKIQPELGKEGKWEQYEKFDGTYRYFRDIPTDELQPGQKQYFVEDVEEALESGDQSWQAPSWNLFVYACNKQRPVSIVTARGHSPETIKTGVRVLLKKGYIQQEPNYLTVFPVGNDDVLYRELCPELSRVAAREKKTPELKRIAIRKSVDKAIEQYGSEPEHRFGMSDDDPQNVDLIIKAMCDCKNKYMDKRFFVIGTHAGENVKLEVFPVDFPVTGQPEGDTDVLMSAS